MKCFTTSGFRSAFALLPVDVRSQARKAYELFQSNPQHPGLRFKLVHPSKPIYSVRISLNCRALGTVSGDVIVWFWIGSHDQYDRLLRQR